MGYKDFPWFEQPENLDTAVWRYLDLSKFAAMLVDSDLYFARADTLGDSFEGSYPVENRARRAEPYKVLGLPKSEVDGLMALHADRAEKWPRLVFVSCWTMRDWESAALWKLYSSVDRGVAVRSTLRRLRESLTPYAVSDIAIGRVRYIDYDGDGVFAETNSLNPFLHKRRSFDFEYELRALLLDMTELERPGEGPSGIKVPVKIADLAERFHVSPMAPVWFETLIRSLVDRFAPGIEVRKSAMGAREPVF